MASLLDTVDPQHRLATLEALETVYGEPVRGAQVKELDHISDHYRSFIEAAPFMVLATVGPEGTDCSPRGDPPGFVRVHDRNTLLIPDRRGNNRIDSLRNIVRDPRVSLLFLIPGVGETMRVNGRATIVTDHALCASFDMDGKLPRSVIVVTAERVYFQCQKALARSRLWDPDTRISRSALPSTGTMIKAMMPSGEEFDGAAYDANYPQHMKNTIY